MGAFFVLLVVVWAARAAYGKGLSEYRATRDHHAAQLARDHRDWHPGRVRRMAGRAWAYWLGEVTQWPPFPSFRSSFGEDLLHARTAAAELRAAGELTRRELHARLEKARAAAADGPAPGEDPAGDPLPLAGDDWPAGVRHRRSGLPHPGTGAPCSSCVDGRDELGDPCTACGGGTRCETPVPSARASSWWLNGEKPCGDCEGTGRSLAGGVCGYCRGWGSADVSADAPEAAPGTVCGACGRPGTEGDPVLTEGASNYHRSHAVEAYVRRRDIAARHDPEQPDEVALGEVGGPLDVAGDDVSEHWGDPPPPGTAPAADWNGRPCSLTRGDAVVNTATGETGTCGTVGARLVSVTTGDGRKVFWDHADTGVLSHPSPAVAGGAVMTTIHDTALEGADTPYEGMQGVLAEFGRQADAIAQAAGDDLAAAATVHGFDRDPATMSDLTDVADLAAQLQARVQSAQHGLAGRHADGAEYHGNGQDAHASAFRPT